MLVVGLLNVWISYALATKRLHDRGRTGWWLAVQLLVLFAALVLLATAFMVPEELRMARFVAAGVTGVGAFGFALWLLVELGFLRGAAGPNRYGQDPLGPRAGRRAALDQLCGQKFGLGTFPFAKRPFGLTRTAGWREARPQREGER